MSKAPASVITADMLIEKLMPLLGLDSTAKVHRLIVDCTVHELVVIYVELYGDTRLLELDVNDLGGADIRYAPKD